MSTVNRSRSTKEPHFDGIDLNTHTLSIITFISNRMAAGAAGPIRNRFGLSVTEARIVFLVGASDANTAAELVRIIGLDKAAISRGVSRLIEMGLIVSERDPLHASRIKLSLTETGHKCCDSLVRFNFGRETHLVSALTVKEQQQFLRSLRKILTNVELTNKLTQTDHFW